MFSLASQLKAGKGLTVVAAVIPGIYAEQADDAHQTKEVKSPGSSAAFYYIHTHQVHLTVPLLSSSRQAHLFFERLE